MDKYLELFLTFTVVYLLQNYPVSCQDTKGIFPYVLNLATRAKITTNATCGEQGPEIFCKLVEHVRIFPAENRHCDVCDARSNLTEQRHPIRNAIDGSNRWWQSPTLTNGGEFNFVTITLDLRQVYQVAYVIVKAANSPRPGNWILEKSIDGTTYSPWQYFAIRKRDCRTLYGLRATRRIPSYLRDDEVICTTRYSKLNPLENGEIFVSLVNGRPGIRNPSSKLLQFTSARYVRLKFQKIRTLNADLMTFRTADPRYVDSSVTRRYYYSIKDISVGGQCICYGHAGDCKPIRDTDRLSCECEHNTCGDNCERCCPLFNQKPWVSGNEGICEACNCHGHADSCVYNATVDAEKRSLNARGEYEGGGVCLNCKDFTTGINCEKCIDGYYRPQGVSQTSQSPCRQCRCTVSTGSTGQCIVDESRVSEGLNPGDCLCKPGYGGQDCRQCAFGYYGYPNCRPCPCNAAGSENGQQCDSRRCVCKKNVEGEKCDRCKPGFYNLDKNNPDGCSPCFCFGVSNSCQSSGLGKITISDMRGGMDGWTLTTLGSNGFTLFPNMNAEGWLEYNVHPSRNQNLLDPMYDETIYYWQAPLKYLGSKLSSYGGDLIFTIKYIKDKTAPMQQYIYDVDVIIQGGNITMSSGKNYLREETAINRRVKLLETNWSKMEKNGDRVNFVPVTKREFMEVLFNVDRLMIRASYHSAQKHVYLRDVVLESVSAASISDVTIPTVEKCACPVGFTGLSCESCGPGYRRINKQLYQGQCEGCNCYGHTDICDHISGRCLNCQHFTTGVNCDECLPGYYGDPLRGTPNDCRPCACPLISPSNNFAARCRLAPILGNYDNYECVDCRQGYTGDRCERCDVGYYGNPSVVGGFCRRCNCNGNIDYTVPGSCDSTSGVCLKCLYNTEGDRCERCKTGYYGTGLNRDCTACNCDPVGSTSTECDRYSGRCPCKDRFGGRRCDQCQSGFGNVNAGCTPCECNRTGSLDLRCNRVTGQCPCRPSIGGLNCDQCKDGHYRFSLRGCLDCSCDRMGTNQTSKCNNVTGICNCLPNVIGQKCDSCQDNYWGLPLGGGCRPCNCSRIGSSSLQCDRRNGQCQCRPGVGGKYCDTCQPGFYGFSQYGCKRCQPCTKPGYICDQNTGECRCPPNTIGDRCERCAPNAWGYDPLNGCKRCDCNLDGSLSRQCDLRTGKCQCKLDAIGDRCDQCQFGYYNFPRCILCSCNINGTEPGRCDGMGKCQCENNGQCPCKANVFGKTCSSCEDNTFSIDSSNPFGCTSCFCFERSARCTQAPYVWSRRRLPDDIISFDQRVTNTVMKKLLYYNIIPDNTQWASIPSTVQSGPIYWNLARDQIGGDMTLSYNGLLKYSVVYRGSERGGSDDQYPEVVVIGNGFHMTYNDNTTWIPNSQLDFSVRLHPSKWKVIGFDGMATRKIMMIVLENVTAVLVRATYDQTVTNAEIKNIVLDVAVPTNRTNSLNPRALGIELCVCPTKYSGLSCQDPSDGYYKVRFNNTTDISDPIRVIGDVRECNCYGHSNRCDSETGICQNCQHNTTGMYCDKCAPGFYGDPRRGTSDDCRPCACPLTTNNFSPTCEVLGGQIYCINCSDGYTGNRCDICERGYYGNPSTPGGKCSPCKCNPQGSLNTECDYRGQCNCLPGISGLKCSSCPPRHAVEMGICISCDEGCTRDLMFEMDELENISLSINITNVFPVPWDRLWKIKNDSIELRAQLPGLQVGDLGNRPELTKNLTSEAEKLLVKSEMLDGKGDKTVIDAAVLNNNATKLADELEELYRKLQDEIGKLEELVQKLFHNKTGVNITATLEQVKAMLREIQGRNHTLAEQKAFNESMLAEKLSERILALKLSLVNTSAVDEKLQDINNRLHDLQQIARETSNNATKAAQKNLNVAVHKQGVEDLLLDIDIANDDVTQLLDDGLQLNEDARKLLNYSRIHLKDFERKASILDTVLPILRNRTSMLASELPSSEYVTRLALEHATNLSIYANLLEKMFEKARADAEAPLRAARVFGNIVKAVNEAEEAAKRAKKAAEDSIRLAGVDNIRDKVGQSLNRSKELLQRSTQTLQGIPGLDNKLQRLKSDINRIEATQSKAKSILDIVLTGINGLPTDISPAAKRVNAQARDIDQKVRDTKDKVDRVLDSIEKDQDKLRYLQNINLDGMFDYINDSVTDTRRKTLQIRTLIGTVEEQSNKTKLAASRLSFKLLELKDNIRKARSQADKVKVSLSSNGNCARSYRGNIRSGTTNSLSFSFKTNSTAENMLVLLIQSPVSKEFMAVDMVGGRMRFLWDVGSGIGTVENTLNIRNEGTFINEKDKWYQVEAERIGRFGILKVFPVANKNAGSYANGTSPVIKSILDLDYNTDYFIGGTPSDYSRPIVVAKGNFKGCIGEVYFDDHRIGLHNFKTTTGRCWGCREPPKVATVATNGFYFDGTGHATHPQVASYKSDQFFVKFSFKTVWDNATLMFSGNKESGDFLYIGLINGQLSLQYYLGGTSYANLQSELTYNDNKFHRVQAQRQKLDGFLQVDNSPAFGAAPGTNTGLELRDKHIYFGGIPEIVDLTPYKKYGQFGDTRFLGCIKEIQIAKESKLNLMKGDTSGVQEGCKSEGFRTCGFYGSGFALYDGVSLDQEEGDLSLSFKTTQDNALLLLATDNDQENYYSLAIVDGKVEGRFSGSSLPLKLTSRLKYNDGHLHNVAVRKVRRKLEMYVDDELVDDGRLPQGTTQIVVTKMFIGGVQRGFTDGQFTVATVEGLSGCINDILIMGQVVNLITPLQYDKADIGRCTLSKTSAANITSEIRLPLPPTTSKVRTTQSPQTTTLNSIVDTTTGTQKTCAAQSTYALNPNALTLGDKEEGFAEINVNEADVSVIFDISFGFRTYHNGIFFYLTNGVQTEYLVTQLMNGQVVVFFYDQLNGFRSINSTAQVTDGQWHTVSVKKGTKRIRLIVDGGIELRENIKRKIDVISPMYIGGYPDGLRPHPEVMDHSMRGCLQDFQLNGNPILIAESEVVSGTSPCFEKVERGVFLTGFSYGIYSQNFKVGDGLTITLEFRTNKQNGIFLSISDPGGFPAMTLELHNGKVKMSVRSSEDKFTAETVNNPYLLCDNKWHRIEASVIKNVVSVVVDDLETAYGSSGGSQRFSETNSQLFLGGFPSAIPQGAAFTDAGFSGCLRNFVIDNNQVDWYQLVSSVDIHKSACPVEDL